MHYETLNPNPSPVICTWLNRIPYLSAPNNSNCEPNLAHILTSQSEPHCIWSTILTLPVTKHRNLSLALARGLDCHGEHPHHPELKINISLYLALILTLEAHPDCNCSGILPLNITKHLKLTLTQDSALGSSEFLFCKPQNSGNQRSNFALTLTSGTAPNSNRNRINHGHIPTFETLNLALNVGAKP